MGFKLVGNRILILLSFLLAFTSARSQDADFQDERVLYKRSYEGGLILHTNGWGANFRMGKKLTGFSQRLFEFEMVSMKHPKEYKSYNPSGDNSKGYIYGKLNSLTVLRSSIGYQKEFFRKQSNNGVGVSYVANGGLSLGFAKPVYLNILAFNDQNTRHSKVERYDPNEHYIDNILSRASWFHGLGEVNVYPGLHGKLGLNFEYYTEPDQIRALEVGVAVDAYAKEVPVMALTDNHQVYVSLYVNILYGIRQMYAE